MIDMATMAAGATLTGLTRIRRHNQICGNCGNPMELGELASWNRSSEVINKHGATESDPKGSNWRCYRCSEAVASKVAEIGASAANAGVSAIASGVSAVSGDSETVAVQDAVVSVPAGRVSGSESSAFGVLADAIAPYLESRLKAKVDEDTVLSLLENGLDQARDQIKSEVTEWIRENMTTTVTVVNAATGESFGMGVQHRQFPVLLQACSARLADGTHLNIWLKGPAGSGKTTAAKEVARALNLPFYFCGSLSEPYGLLGFTDANGKVVRTQFREAYEHGGVFLFDEIDGSDPAAVLPFNAALANGRCAFPDAGIERHPDTIIIAAANTYGLGANDAYVGRLKLDGASLNRFCWLDWDVDEKLETATCPDSAWCKKVQTVRANVKRLGIKVLVTPRASYYGSALLAAGLDMATVERMALQGAMTADQWSQVKA